MSLIFAMAAARRAACNICAYGHFPLDDGPSCRSGASRDDGNGQNSCCSCPCYLFSRGPQGVTRYQRRASTAVGLHESHLTWKHPGLPLHRLHSNIVESVRRCREIHKGASLDNDAISTTDAHQEVRSHFAEICPELRNGLCYFEQ